MVLIIQSFFFMQIFILKVVLRPLMDFVTSFAFFLGNSCTLMTGVVYVVGVGSRCLAGVSVILDGWFVVCVGGGVHYSGTSFLVIDSVPLVFSR